MQIEAATATRSLSEFVFNQMPVLNTAIEAKTTSPAVLVEAVRPLLTAVRAEVATAGELKPIDARKMLQLLGFSISSVERHFQASGECPGIGKAMLGDFDGLLLHLGRWGLHPPRDSDTTYWYLNNPCQFTFTGDGQEAHFNRVVNLQRHVQSEACRLLRPICSGVLPVTSGEAAQSMAQAARGLEDLLDAYDSLTEIVNGGYRFSPDFFMCRMRTYLVGYPIGGEVWSGPNAANLSANMSLDYLVGVSAPWYSEVVQSRWRYLVKEDQDELQADMGCTSLTERVVQALGLNLDVIPNWRPEELAVYITKQKSTIQEMMAGFGELLVPVNEGTGKHWRFITDYLIRNAKKMSAEEYAALPVKPDEGTGKMAHGQTRQIMEMRRKHPIVSKLLAAIRLGQKEMSRVRSAQEERSGIHA
jgi:hypothetical protein